MLEVRALRGAISYKEEDLSRRISPGLTEVAPELLQSNTGQWSASQTTNLTTDNPDKTHLICY